MKERKQYQGDPGTKILTAIHKYFPKVAKVFDADKPAYIEVTPEDVRNAKIKSSEDCAFALACNRTFHADVLIWKSVAYIIKGAVATRYKNTMAIQTEIVSFDRKGGFDVGKYKLAIFSGDLRLGVYRASKTHPHTKNGKREKQF